ncbi:hypothetical protein CALVIDRAFT_531038 [Calocera viscosa TUFC12733]|uniref:Uncharacterized protein n=1 Tax=Calocera viscosa (strain TUFC12733) TaxID=1330018 RepID=A0A167H251_CALVF|nr:hypothetical protein CALVIDRAFT_531038 [Calocera viscosa TUFC12733]
MSYMPCSRQGPATRGKVRGAKSHSQGSSKAGVGQMCCKHTSRGATTDGCSAAASWWPRRLQAARGYRSRSIAVTTQMYTECRCRGRRTLMGNCEGLAGCGVPAASAEDHRGIPVRSNLRYKGGAAEVYIPREKWKQMEANLWLRPVQDQVHWTAFRVASCRSCCILGVPTGPLSTGAGAACLPMAAACTKSWFFVEGCCHPVVPWGPVAVVGRALPEHVVPVVLLPGTWCAVHMPQPQQYACRKVVDCATGLV